MDLKMQLHKKEIFGKEGEREERKKTGELEVHLEMDEACKRLIIIFTITSPTSLL